MPPEFLLDEQAALGIASLARKIGKTGNEVALLLAGQRTTVRPIQLDRLLIPRQTALQSRSGCGLLVDGGCLNRLGPEMRKTDRAIYGILHSHPGEAYHSSTDANGVLMRFHNAFSIVIPDFGRRPHLLEDAAAYKFDYNSSWQEVQVANLIHLNSGTPWEFVYDD